MVHPIMILIVDLNSSKERKEEGMEGHTDRRTDGRTDGRMDGRTDRRMDGRTDKQKDQKYFLRRWDKSRFYEGGTDVVF
jgi:hypothetical protein